DDVIAEVERRPDVRLDRSEVKTGAWMESAGHRTGRGTWYASAPGHRPGSSPSHVGTEAASVISGVPKPAWFQTATWTDVHCGRVWRAEEMELITEPVVAEHGTMLTTEPNLPQRWWAELRSALVTLAAYRTFRVSGRQELITRRVNQVFPGAVDTTVTEWTTSHGDLHWGNLTTPTLYLLDWGDWGLAPRGNDAACLWASALAVPEAAARVHAEFHEDLDSRAGKIARLWVCSNILRIADRRADAYALVEPAATAADQLVKDLR
ncbi:MAG: phosphotransferase, partial [Pseudonocardiaceae bacterium]